MGKTILVIDDEAGYREMLQFELSAPEYEVVAASSGMQALDIMAGRKVDLVVTDMKMPQMDGLDVVVAVKGKYPGVPIVLMTGYAMEDRVQKALSLKATTCLRKPFEVSELRSILEFVL